jgi:surfeit locus 1 family protein
VPLTLTLSRSRWSASWGMTLLTVLAVAGFVDLGHWQWQRAQQKRTLATAFTAGDGVASELDTRASAALPRYAQVRVHGRYDGAHQFLLDNISHAGRAGYDVLTPMLLADGRTLLVNRGWVPLTSSRRQLPDVALHADTELVAAGKLDDLPVVGIALGHVAPIAGSDWPKLTSFPTMSDLAAALGRPTEARQLLLNPDEPFGYLRDWHPGGLSAERHLSYAVQWWSFAALALVLYAVLNRGKARR